MKTLVAIIAALLVVIIGLSIYLAPNDLVSCGEVPGEVKPCQKADAIVAVSGGDTPARVREAVAL